MKAYFYNASARKHFNTAQLLESAMKGASDAGAECEFVNLLTIGMVNEMFIGSRNDEYKWPEIGDQQAMDNF